MKEIMPDHPLNEAEYRLQSWFSFPGLAGAALIAFAVFALSWWWQVDSNRVPMGRRTVALTMEPLNYPAEAAGPLKMAGAWRLTAPDPRFGGLSALAIDDGRFLALSDSGVTFRFGLPGGDPTVSIADVPDGPGPATQKENRDSESLARDRAGRGWWVGYETTNQIWLYDHDFKRTLMWHDFGDARWPFNLGIEAMIDDPGRLRLVPELAHEVIDVANRRAVSRPLRDVGSSISDMTRLPDGRVIVLLRSFGVTGFHCALGVLTEHPDGFTIEQRIPLHFGLFANLEGMTTQHFPSGRTRLWLITDDNLQPPMTTILTAIDLTPGSWPGAAN